MNILENPRKLKNPRNLLLLFVKITKFLEFFKNIAIKTTVFSNSALGHWSAHCSDLHLRNSLREILRWLFFLFRSFLADWHNVDNEIKSTKSLIVLLHVFAQLYYILNIYAYLLFYLNIYPNKHCLYTSG